MKRTRKYWWAVTWESNEWDGKEWQWACQHGSLYITKPKAMEAAARMRQGAGVGHFKVSRPFKVVREAASK